MFCAWTKFRAPLAFLNYVDFQIDRDFSPSIASFASGILRFDVAHRELSNLVFKVSGDNSVLAGHSGIRERYFVPIRLVEAS
jgi:hypothetical protein